MSVRVTAPRNLRRAGGLALLGAVASMLAACAGGDVPVPFVTSPDPETTATAPAEPATVEASALPEAAPANAPAAPPPRAAAHSPLRQDLPFPSFAQPAPAPGTKPVLDETQQSKMQSDLEALAKRRESSMRQEIEQAQ